MKILLANPRGFCAGVDRAVEILNQAVEVFSKNIYVKHDIVHNKRVINHFRLKGVQFIEDIELVPEHSILIFSAHGVSYSVIQQAHNKRLQLFDATCPLVSKVHMQVAKYSRKEYDCILIGHKNHPEVEGTMGRYFGKKGKIFLVENEIEAKNIQINQPNKVGLVTQTTLSLDDTQEIIKILHSRFPLISTAFKNDICYATQNRQDAVKKIAQKSDLILVIGSKNSSNSNRLVEISKKIGTESFLVDDPQDINLEIFKGIKNIGITSGASAPESIVKEVLVFLEKHLPISNIIEVEGVKEDIYFKLPSDLKQHQIKVIKN